MNSLRWQALTERAARPARLDVRDVSSAELVETIAQTLGDELFDVGAAAAVRGRAQALEVV